MGKSRQKSGPRTSYAVFLRVDSDAERRLSPAAREGLGYARRLAKRDLERSRAALFGDPLPPATLADFALNEAESPSTIRRRIQQARKELWGDLSDAGVYYRLRQARRRQESPVVPRRCEAPGCGKDLPATATPRRRFCPGSRCRTRAHRARHPSAILSQKGAESPRPQPRSSGA